MRRRVRHLQVFQHVHVPQFDAVLAQSAPMSLWVGETSRQKTASFLCSARSSVSSTGASADQLFSRSADRPINPKPYTPKPYIPKPLNPTSRSADRLMRSVWKPTVRAQCDCGLRTLEEKHIPRISHHTCINRPHVPLPCADTTIHDWGSMIS